MNTRTTEEMLLLAARAQGLNIQRSRLDDPMWRDMLLDVQDPERRGVGKGWNPRTDDGDSRRLQMALGLILQPTGAGILVRRAAYFSGREVRCFIQCDPTDLDAARLAVLTAAAEMGAEMRG